MRIAIGNDHAGVEMKMAVKAHLEERGIEVVNMGTDSSESCDYPIYGERIGKAVASGEAESPSAAQVWGSPWQQAR